MPPVDVRTMPCFVVKSKQGQECTAGFGNNGTTLVRSVDFILFGKPKRSFDHSCDFVAQTQNAQVSQYIHHGI